MMSPVILGKSKGRQERVMGYSKAGHLIANHTFSHPRLSDTVTDEYIKEIDNADKLIRQFPTYTKWFRFPFLNEGDTLKKRDAIRNHLKKMGYINGYVTIDNYDYFIDMMVQKAIAKGQKVNLDRACTMLVELMWDGIQYYDAAAQKHIGKVRHVLLMHENDIEAQCLEKLITHLNTNDWKIVSPQYAFADPLLQVEPDTMYLGQGRVAAIAHEKFRVKFRSKWEDTNTLKREFKRRKIIY
ncbi:MAG: polysaccharide deacetylase family protein [Bdellovibrionaceae bacterium]|nr:polysaccharide deacetylase family protein [Pseudobdellovibrionaceae bacterium]